MLFITAAGNLLRGEESNEVESLMQPAQTFSDKKDNAEMLPSMAKENKELSELVLVGFLLEFRPWSPFT